MIVQSYAARSTLAASRTAVRIGRERREHILRSRRSFTEAHQDIASCLGKETVYFAHMNCSACNKSYPHLKRGVRAKERMMATFVLVQGAWCGAWVWQWVTPYLRDARHQVYATTLSGVGERIDLAHAGITLDTHITDVVTALEFADLRDVTLVGWSYGGMIIAGVADRVPERLAQVIHLDAYVPEDGQSSYDVDRERDPDLAAVEAAGTPGFIPPPLGWIEQEAVLDEEVRAVLLARMTPHPLAAFAQPIRLTNP